MGVGDHRHLPAALPSGERPDANCTGGWVGPRTGLNGCRKSRPPPGFDPRTIHPVASRCTNRAIPPIENDVKYLYLERFGVTAVWDITLFGLVDIYRRFGGS
jgi:hypothetical protein